MNNFDERLERIENHVELLVERQRISRFDNLMLLLYPLVTLGMTLLISAVQHYGTVPRGLLAEPLEIITLYVTYYGGIIFILGMVVPFIQFIHAYATDDLRGRVDASQLLPMFPIYLLTVVIIMMPQSWIPIVWLAAKGGELAWGFGFTLLASILFSAVFFAPALGTWIKRRLISWFERNAPLAFAATKSVRLKGGRLVSFSQSRAVLEQDMNDALRLSKISWCAFCFFYGAMVVEAIWVSGQFEFMTYYVGVLIALLAVTAPIVSRRIRHRLWATLRGHHS